MAAAKPLPTQERLRELFDYDEATGLLLWRRRDDIGPGFNGRFAGKRAGSLSDRYWRVMVDHRNFTYHRVIWKFVYGTEPSSEIDHINGDTSDNRIANLREGDRWLNAKNRSPTRGRSLPKGVRLQKYCKNYQAYIVRQRLGYFSTPEEAHAAYLKAAKEQWGEWVRTED